MKLRKFIVTILTLISTVCIAFGFSGCDTSGFLSEKGYNVPNSIELQESPLSSYIEQIEDETEINKIYAMFNSVEFKQLDTLSEENDYILLGLSVCMDYEDSIIYFYVAENGKSIYDISDSIYISQENAVDYNLLKNYINH